MEITVVDFGGLGNYRTWSGLSIGENLILRKFPGLVRGREFSRHQVTPPTILLCYIYTVHYFFVFYKDVPYLASELIRLFQVWLHIRQALVTVYLKCLSPSMRTLTFASILFLHGSTHGLFHGFRRGSHLLEEMAMLDAEFGGGGGGKKEEVTEGRKGEERGGGREQRRKKERFVYVCVCTNKM